MTVTPRPSDKYIPYYIVLFFIVLTFVFGSFVYLAKTTHSGVVTDAAYEKGLHYNQIIEKAAVQEALGFASTIEKTGGNIVFTLRDKQGAGVSRADVRITFFRPAHEGIDFSLPMAEDRAGVYTAAYTLPEKGMWELRVLAKTKSGPYQATKRIVFD